MRVLGIDPGSVKTGWGVLDGPASRPRLVAGGLIRLGSDQAFAHRLHRLRNDLEELIAVHTPEVAAVESLFHGKSASSSLKLAHARGVILSVLAGAGLSVCEYTPATVKKAVTGSGRADKQQVRLMVARFVDSRAAAFGSDVTDALAVALCHAASAGFAAAVARSTREPDVGVR